MADGEKPETDSFLKGQSALYQQKGISCLIPVAIIVAAVVPYLNTLSNPFIFDDIPSLYDASRMAHRWKVNPAYSRWLTSFSFAVTCFLGGMNPAIHRLFNICLHGGSALLLYGLIRRTLVLPVFGYRFRRSAVWLAGAVSSLWAAHPLQTETVSYVAQRCEGLTGFFFLLTLYCFARAVTSTRPHFWHDSGIAACLFGMGAKEVMISAPIVVFLYDRFYGAGSFSGAFRKRWAVHLAHFAAMFALPVTLIASQGSAVAGGYGSLASSAGWWSYLRVESKVILYYLRLAFFPHPICLDYGWTVSRELEGTTITFVITAAIVITAIVGTIAGRKSAFPLMFFFAVLAPTSSFHPLPDVIAEHRMYLPLAAVTVLAVMAFGGAVRGLPSHRVRVAVAGGAWSIVLIALSAMTAFRNTDYRSEAGMWRSVIALEPENARAKLGLGAALAAEGQIEEAEKILRETLAALPPLQQEKPKDAFAETIRAKAYNILGALRQRSGRLEEAEIFFRRALESVPRFSMARANLGLVLYLQNRKEEAASEWRFVAETDGSAGALAYEGLASLALETGDPSAAVRWLEKAVDAEPAAVEARRDLAWLLAVSRDPSIRDGKRALKFAREAARYTKNSEPFVLDVLAAAYAECGDFEEAIRWATRALDLLPREQTSETRNAIIRRINTYKKGEPFRE